MKRRLGLALVLLTIFLPGAGTLDAQSPSTRGEAAEPNRSRSPDATQQPVYDLQGLVVTARRQEEVAQEVPIPLTVVNASLVERTGTFNVNRLKELVPTVQFYSSNPRNTAINIRGLGAPYGLTNDGIEVGVGYYVDGVFFARPAAATLDFLDVEQIEVLRGPQGTLFGKNTTAGAINVTTRRPSLTPDHRFEVSYGNLGYIQGKASVGGPLTEALSARLSLSGTRRDGTLRNVATGEDENDLDNLGARGQLQYFAAERLRFIAAGDYTRQRPRGFAQVVAGIAPTQRSANRQFPQIVADLGYAPPSLNAFDRMVDTDTHHQSHQDLGGGSLTGEWNIGAGQFTSITAWRFWDWDPSNDRDFLGLPITTISANPSKQRQWTQEVRYAGEIARSVSFLAGVYGFRQTIHSTGNQEQGAAAARFLLTPSAVALTPGLLDGYGMTSDIRSSNLSAALFGQLEWEVTDRLRLLPGLRFNYDQKEVDYDAQIYGGLQTANPALVALQRSILAPQRYTADVDDSNVSGQLTVAYRLVPQVNGYATYATSFKSVGLNLAGVPTDRTGQPALSAATVKPEDERHFEVGLKTSPLPNVTTNVTFFNTDIRDFQAQVVNQSVGVLRGYLANAERVRVRGAELDGAAYLGNRFSAYASVAFTDGRYLSFPDAPPPLEETGGSASKDISGEILPGISRWAYSLGGEVVNPITLAGRVAYAYVAVNTSYRSSFSSSATPSKYLMVDAYSLFNTRVGVRLSDGWTFSLWGRNLLDSDYYEFLSAAPGGSGLYVGLPGDPRTVGLTLGWTL